MLIVLGRGFFGFPFSGPLHELMELFGTAHCVFDYKVLSSSRRKYCQFAVLNHCADSPLLPIFPLRLSSLIRFAWWLPSNNVSAGWDSVSNYIGDVIAWGKSLGHLDVRRLTDSPVWETFRDGFPKRVQVIKKSKDKIPIRIQHLEAISLDTDLNLRSDRQNLAAYAVLFFSSVRIGHFSPNGLKEQDTRHLLRWRHVLFSPSVHDPVHVFLSVPTSKTRGKVLAKPWWTALARNNRFPKFCPVRLLQLLFALDWNGDPDAWVLTDEKGRRPLLRYKFIRQLRGKLLQSAPRLGVPSSEFVAGQISSKSFRKGGASALSKTDAPPQRLADHMDHSSVDMTRRYAVADVADRASDTVRMADLFMDHAQ